MPQASACGMSSIGIQQYVPGGFAPDRLKSNEEWVSEANAAADAAAQAVIRSATVQRLHTLHQAIISNVGVGAEVPLELLEEYGTLAGV